MGRIILFTALYFFFVIPEFLLANQVIINFEDLADSDAVTTQYANLTFSNATALTAGVSLNEFDFPPSSGATAIFDDGAPISIDFGTPITELSGFFNYIVPLTITAFDSGNSQVAQVFSSFSSNITSLPDPGSSVNELIALNFAGGISKVTIAGDPAGYSFTLDDLTYTTLDVQPVPEPSTILLIISGIPAIVAAGVRKYRQSRCG